MLATTTVLVGHGFVGVLFLKHRGTPLVRASGGALSGLALLCMSASCLSLMLFLGPPGNMVCRLQMPLNSILPTVALATITILSLEVSGGGGAASAAWKNTTINQSMDEIKN